MTNEVPSMGSWNGCAWVSVLLFLLLFFVKRGMSKGALYRPKLARWARCSVWGWL
jgi:hypothetical protein